MSPPVPSGSHVLIEDDCLSAMARLPAGSVDMVLCDLPYGTTQNDWDSLIPLDRLWAEYVRLVKPRGAIVLTSQGMFTARLMVSNPRLFKYKLTWVKSKPTNFLNAKRQPLRQHEDVCVFYRQQPSYVPQMSPGVPYSKGVRKDQFTGSYGRFQPSLVASADGDRHPTDVVYFKTAESEGPVWHPTQKPVGLGRYLVRTYTRPGDVVLDNACGSGSFLVAAALEGRRSIGMERNEGVALFKDAAVDYIEVARSRLMTAGATPVVVRRPGAEARPVTTVASRARPTGLPMLFAQATLVPHHPGRSAPTTGTC